MASTSTRLLTLLGLLQSRRFWAGDELAERLEVSERTLRRDVERLRELGYPVAASRGVGGGYRLAAGATLPPLLVDDEEAVAIVLGVQAAAGTAVSGVADASLRALVKVVRVLPEHLRRRVDDLRAMTVPAPGPGDTYNSQPQAIDVATLTTVAQACRGEEALRFTYISGAGERSAREVEPHRLVSRRRRWYLVAYDRDRQAWRTFRMDRVAELAPTGARFHPRTLPAADAAAFVEQGIASMRLRYDVEVVVRAPAHAVAAYVRHWGSVEEVDAGTARLRMSVDGLEWVAMVLGALDADFDVIAPSELRAMLGTWGERFARAAAAPAAAAAAG